MKSRMREIRTSGSVGGLDGNAQAYPTHALNALRAFDRARG